MRAIVVNEHGGPEVLRAGDWPDPAPGPGELLVEVAAAGVNYMDIYQRENRPPYAQPPPYVPGVEGAGTVTAVGTGVSGFAPGDAVAWPMAAEGYAEQALIPADRVVAVPAGVEPEVAAAVLLQGMTAQYLCTDTYPVAEGDLAVVLAAAGGVGLLLTQMIKMRGGTVLAVTSTPQKADLARQAGADRVAGYAGFAAAAREMTGGAGAAVVYDSVGATTFDDSLGALAPRGYLVLYGAASGPVPPFDPQRLNTGGSLFLTRPTLIHYIATRAELAGRAEEIFGWVAAGRLSVRIGGRYPLADAGQAHRDLAARATTGKLLLIP